MIVIFLHALSLATIAGRINAQANDIVLMAASLLLFGFGIYQIRVGATALMSN